LALLLVLHYAFSLPAQHLNNKTNKLVYTTKMSWAALEEKDGVRFSFNAWPDDRQSANKLAVPLGCLVSPLKEIGEVPVRVIKPFKSRRPQSVYRL